MHHLLTLVDLYDLLREPKYHQILQEQILAQLYIARPYFQQYPEKYIRWNPANKTILTCLFCYPVDNWDRAVLVLNLEQHTLRSIDIFVVDDTQRARRLGYWDTNTIGQQRLTFHWQWLLAAEQDHVARKVPGIASPRYLISNIEVAVPLITVVDPTTDTTPKHALFQEMITSKYSYRPTLQASAVLNKSINLEGDAFNEYI